MTNQDQLATVFIDGTRREMDRMREDFARDLRAVHHRITELADRLAALAHGADPVVQAFRDQFNATVRPGSIHPLDS